MAARLIQGHRAQLVHGAYKFHLLRPVQIDQREHLELAERQHRSDHILIFGTSRRLLLGGGAEWIYSSGSAKRFIQQFAIGGDNERFKALDRNAVTRLDDGSLAGRGIAKVIKPLLIDRFDLVASPVKLTERDHL